MKRETLNTRMMKCPRCLGTGEGLPGESKDGHCGYCGDCGGTGELPLESGSVQRVVRVRFVKEQLDHRGYVRAAVGAIGTAENGDMTQIRLQRTGRMIRDVPRGDVEIAP